jgi:predicted lipoprotein with Yx(FWY)xxD motif
MNRSRPIALVAVVPLIAAAVAGCGNNNNNNNGGATASAPAPKTTSGRSATIGVENTDLGKTLVDSQGRTIYLFRKDTGTNSTCSGECASDWPPVRVTGKPTVGSGLKASLVGTTQRSDGKPQVTYNGHPLYLFKGDSNAGDTNGEGITAFGAAWFALSPAGDEIPASSSGGGNGY